MCGRAAAPAWLGRAAAWRSRARRQCTFQTKSAFGRNRALSGRARRAKLWALSSGRCRRAAPPLRSSYVVLSPQKGGRSVEFQNTESLELESASSLRKRSENHAALLKETPPHTSDRARPLEGTGLRESRPRRREPREIPSETPSPHYEQHNNTLLKRSSPRRTSPARTASPPPFCAPPRGPPPPPSPAAQHVS